jgi:hypothetical protein
MIPHAAIRNMTARFTLRDLLVACSVPNPRDLRFYPHTVLQRSKTRSTLTALFKVTIYLPTVAKSGVPDRPGRLS